MSSRGPRRAPPPRRRTPRRRPGCPTTPPGRARCAARRPGTRFTRGWSDARPHARPSWRRQVSSGAGVASRHHMIGKTLRHSMVPPVGHQGRDLARGRLVVDLDGVEAGDQLAGVGVGAVGVDGVVDLGLALAGRHHAAVLGALQRLAADDAAAELGDRGLEGLVLAEGVGHLLLAGGFAAGQEAVGVPVALADQVDVGVGHGRSSRKSCHSRMSVAWSPHHCDEPVPQKSTVPGIGFSPATGAGRAQWASSCSTSASMLTCELSVPAGTAS